MEKRWQHDPKRSTRFTSLSKPERKWRVHEQTSAKRTGGMDKPRPDAADGMAFNSLYLRECKHTVNDSLSVKKAWLEKLDREALAKGKLPMLVIGFENLALGVDKQWACIPLQLLAQIMEGKPIVVEAQNKVKDPVYQGKDKRWYFANETWDREIGPFDTEAMARKECSWYAKSL